MIKIIMSPDSTERWVRDTQQPYVKKEDQPRGRGRPSKKGKQIPASPPSSTSSSSASQPQLSDPASNRLKTCKGCQKISERLRIPPRHVSYTKKDGKSIARIAIPGLHPQVLKQRRVGFYQPPKDCVLDKITDIQVSSSGISVFCLFNGHPMRRKVEHYDLWNTKNCFSRMAEYLEEFKKSGKEGSKSQVTERLFQWVKWGVRHEEHLGLKYEPDHKENSADEWLPEWEGW